MKFAIQIVLVSCVAISSCLCDGYSSGGSSGDYGGISSGGISGSSGGYGPSYEGIGSVPGKRPEGSKPGRVVQAAVQTRQTVRFVNVDIPFEEREPQIIEVPGNPIPIIMQFKSASSRIRVQQSHSGLGSGQVQETKSEDQPQLLRHEVTKPIIQEVREIVMPYRRVVQEIRPVVEEIQTVVAKKSDRDSQFDEKETTGGISGSVGFGGGIKGATDSNVKRSTRFSNYGRY